MTTDQISTSAGLYPVLCLYCSEVLYLCIPYGILWWSALDGPARLCGHRAVSDAQLGATKITRYSKRLYGDTPRREIGCFCCQRTIFEVKKAHREIQFSVFSVPISEASFYFGFQLNPVHISDSTYLISNCTFDIDTNTTST